MAKYVLGVDIGYSNLKVVGGVVKGQAPEMERGMWLRPACAVPVSELHREMSGAVSRDGIRVLVNGHEYAAAVSPNAVGNWQRCLHEEYPLQDSYMALFRAALSLAGQARVDRVVTGLPVKQADSKQLKEKMKERLVGVHQVSKDLQVTVGAVDIIAQPVGGFMDAVWGQEWMDHEPNILVCDPGFYSVDWALISANKLVSSASNTSVNATSALIEAVMFRINQDHGARSVSVEKLESAIREGMTSIMVKGKMVSLLQYIEKDGTAVIRKAVEEMQNSQRMQKTSVDKVILVGGAAEMFKPMVEKVFGADMVTMPKLPAMANARGYWRFGGFSEGGA